MNVHPMTRVQTLLIFVNTTNLFGKRSSEQRFDIVRLKS